MELLQQALFDPRTPNCQGYSVDGNGKVTGVYLRWIEVPNSKYALVKAALINEENAQGRTVATVRVFKANMTEDMDAKIYLAWPFGGGIDVSNFARPIRSGQDHVITNKYSPPNLGPLAIVIGDLENGFVDSDYLGGLGLPFGHHVNYGLNCA